MIGNAIRTKLLADVSGVTVWPVIAPQGTQMPYVVYQSISGAPDQTHDGMGTTTFVRIQISVYSDAVNGFDIVKAKADLIRNSLGKYQGVVSGVTMQGVIADSERDIYERPLGGDRGIYGVQQDYLIWYS